MPRGNRPKPSSPLISDDILKEIKSIRPLRLFINKQKRKGNADNPFTLRVQFCQLPKEKQARYLQKSVDKYIQLLDENDVDEQVQIDCRLFDYLLMKGEQKKYFESINAPVKPPGNAIPLYTQVVRANHVDDEHEPTWKSLSLVERQNYKKLRQVAKAEYLCQARNFCNELPERLRTDYLLFVEQTPNKRQALSNALLNNPEDTMFSSAVRQRRKSLASLPESLTPAMAQSTNLPQSKTRSDNQPKLTKEQLRAIHDCMPNLLYYETNIADKDKPAFTRTMTKNAYMRSLFNQLDEDEKLKYILISVKKWYEFLECNPNIIEQQIATLHLLLYKNEDIVSYFTALGLPQRPPINSYLFYNQEKEALGSDLLWSDLSVEQRNEYTQKLAELKNEYYQKLVHFVDQALPSDYIKYEFFRNVKTAVKDYESATKSEIFDKITGKLELAESYVKRAARNNDINLFNHLKHRLLSTELTFEQRHLVEELTQLLYRHIQ